MRIQLETSERARLTERVHELEQFRESAAKAVVAESALAVTRSQRVASTRELLATLAEETVSPSLLSATKREREQIHERARQRNAIREFVAARLAFDEQEAEHSEAMIRSLGSMKVMVDE